MKRNGLITGLIVFAIFFPIFSSYALDPKSKPAKPTAETLAKPAEKPLPDLVVERVWLDAQSQINFQIKNGGKGEIPDSEHNQGVVKVDYGKGQENFCFTKASSTGKSPVDPKGVLKKPGGSVQYDTKIKVGSSVTVTIVVDEEGKIAESNEHNNKSAATTLTPSSLSLPKDVKVPYSGKKPLLDKESKVAKTATPAVPKPGAPVLKKVVDGIDIIFPGEGVVLNPGQQFGLKIKSVWETKQYISFIALYRIREDGPDEAVIEQRFPRDSGPVLEPGNTMLIEQRIPESAPEGVYIYQVSTIGMYHSYSDRFGVRPVGSRPSIQVLTPGGGGEHWKTGSTHAIRWYYRNVGSTDLPERWTMTLNRVRRIGTGSDYTKTLESGVERKWLGDKWEYTHQWLIPQNFTHGDYRISISVEEGKRKGMSIKGKGSLAFTIGGGDWNLKVNRIFTDPVSGNLVAEVINERPGVSGRVDFRVSQIDPSGRELGEHRRWDLMRTLSGGESEIIDLGKLGPLAESPPSSGENINYDQLPRFKVTIDSTNRVDEKNEEDNSIQQHVAYNAFIGKVEIICDRTNRPLSHNEICPDNSQCLIPIQLRVNIYNFGAYSVRPMINVEQEFLTTDPWWPKGSIWMGEICPVIGPGTVYRATIVSNREGMSWSWDVNVVPKHSKIKFTMTNPDFCWLSPNPFIVELLGPRE